ncbi:MULTISPECIES: amylo-alpha-1,6-glucosidase [Rhodomicrobium]|uniref:amylo-alpha-1,6-glucosidase n=1 Tax=Rhodomicrobium TaxID=1068 RepID=UPI000B4BC0AF|nr:MULTISPECIES: amylo-alpha-1,6-glucosidase [Rhodomicrobium]
MTAESALETTKGPDGFSEAPFYITARGQSSRARRTLKHGDAFLVLDSYGDIGASAGGQDGLFHCDTRFLSYLEVVIDGLQPLLLGSNVRDDNSLLTVELTNPDIFADGELVLRKDTVHITRNIFVWRGTLYQRLSLKNYGDRPVNFRATIYFGSDFADIFEVRGMRRQQRGVVNRRVAGPDKVVMTYLGLDGQARRSTVMFDPAPTEIGTNSASHQITLQPDEEKAVFLTVGCDQAIDERPSRFLAGFLAVRRELRAPGRAAATVETSNVLFNEILCQSMADMSMLLTDTPEGQYPYAGIPWFSTTFGRDGLITAIMLLWANPRIARGVLRRLARYQAKIEDPASDAQPGKILHEMRGGEMAALGEVPFARYYGSVDSTPLFLVLLGRYVARTNDMETLRELWPAAEAALAWIDQYGDMDGDGFVEYFRATDDGLANQGWKDSDDSIFHADGRLARGPLALCEVQGYVYEAKRRAAHCARLLGEHERARQLDEQATQLAERFEAAFWLPELETYALALDGDKQPCRVRSSNAGHLLFSGIVRPDRGAMVARELLRPRFFSGWGIRTIAKDEARYNPMSYHNGSIWPHDNAMIAMGLAQYGAKDEVERVFRGLADAATYMELRRLPELFCGFQRSKGRGPTLYPVACAPQAWASATPFALLEAALGLEFDPQAREIRMRNPRLPEFLDEVTIRDLRLGDASVDFVVRRHGTDVSVQLLRGGGNVRVSVVFDGKAETA